MKISNTIAGIATLALAAVPMFALGTVAYAAPVTVQVADLNLGSSEGALELDRRVNAAANSFCADERVLSVKVSCKEAIRAEAFEKIAAIKTQATVYAAR